MFCWATCLLYRPKGPECRSKHLYSWHSHGEMGGRTGRIPGCLQTREPAIPKSSDNNNRIGGHFYNFYLLDKCLMTPYHASYGRSQEEGAERGSSLQEPHLMSGRQRRSKTACGRHWCSDCTPSLRSSPPFFSLSDGNLLGLSL